MQNQLEGIVIRARPYGETNKIITLFHLILIIKDVLKKIYLLQIFYHIH